MTWPAKKLEQLAGTLSTLTFGQIAFAVAALFSGYLLARILTSLLGDFLADNVLLLVRWKDTLRRIVMALLLSTIGFLASVIHLYIFDRRFLRLGTLQTVKQKSDE
jgi:MFS family permease